MRVNRSNGPGMDRGDAVRLADSKMSKALMSLLERKARSRAMSKAEQERLRALAWRFRSSRSAIGPGTIISPLFWILLNCCSHLAWTAASAA